VLLVVSEEIQQWFQYIWEQFARINSLQMDYRLTTYQELNHLKNTNSPVIEYGDRKRYAQSLFIPKRHVFTTDDYIWLNDHLPVYRGTIAENSRDMEYDIFFNAFVHLSRLEEWEFEKTGKFVRSYSSKHPRKKKEIWKLPVVNYLFGDLERRVKEKFPNILFGDKTRPIMEFSHDVDYIKKTIQLMIKQTAFDFYNAFRYFLRLDLKGSISRLKKYVSFAFNNCDYWCFDYWTELEKILDIKSVYYFFAKSESKSFNLKQWLIDPSYDISQDKRLKDKCKELISHSSIIGIHGSYFSASHESLLKNEKEILENAFDYKIIKARQHWLNYYENTTPYILSNAGIEEDSTIGFNDIPGFRAGVASVYNPYDHNNNMPFSFKEVPLVVMDSHLYDYSDGYNVEDMHWLFDSMMMVKNFAVSINWHQRGISKNYGWDLSYRKIASKTKEVISCESKGI